MSHPRFFVIPHIIIGSLLELGYAAPLLGIMRQVDVARYIGYLTILHVSTSPVNRALSFYSHIQSHKMASLTLTQSLDNIMQLAFLNVYPFLRLPSSSRPRHGSIPHTAPGTFDL